MIDKGNLLKKKVEDIDLNKESRIIDLIKQFSKVGGFTAKKIYEAYEILNEMFKESEIRIISFPACIISTGIRGIIAKALKKKLFDLVITTCGTLDHDFARIFSDYYQGFFEADDIMLSDLGIHRLGNIFIPKESYGETIEKNLRPILEKIYERKKVLGTYELVWEIGKELENIPKIKEKIDNSLIYICYKKKIPMIIPGITDGAFGTQILIFKMEKRDFEVSVWKDEEFLSKIFFGDKNIGALIIGGGISKHHTIWWSQFSNGLKYSVYITTAVEYDGSLSGARTREAISWGKIKKEAKHVTVEGDATVILPLILAPFL